jgi:UDP-glucose 4-epimerase
MRRILITGGCGFIGTNLVDALLASGLFEIRVFDNESLGKREYLSEWDVEFLHGDLRDADAVTKAAAGMDCVVHLAADTRVMDSIVDPEKNLAANLSNKPATNL